MNKRYVLVELDEENLSTAAKKDPAAYVSNAMIGTGAGHVRTADITEAIDAAHNAFDSIDDSHVTGCVQDAMEALS